MSKLLQITDLNRHFGGLHVTDNVSFAVERGQIKGVIGPNGAGKTTLFNQIAGTVVPDSGTIEFEGRPTTGLPPYRVAELGISRTFQQIRLFPGMTVLENVLVGRHLAGRAGFLRGMLNLPACWKEERDMRRHSREMLDLVGIGHAAEADAASLPFGQQRAVELARALAGNPRLMLLDEPASGLNMHETAELAEMLRAFRDRGITILLVEHDMSLVMDICDEVVVIDHGSKLAEDTPRNIQRNPDVIRVYLGEDEEMAV